jgi:hypothetical protein
MIRLNYGELPTREQFLERFAEELGSKDYKIRHGAPSKPGYIRPSEGDYSRQNLWEELEILVEIGSDESLGWASDILYTLGFEYTPNGE